MNKLLTAITLTSLIGIQNTTITQTTNRIVYMDKTSYWTYQTFTNQENIITGIEAYQSIETYNSINTEAFNIKQRALVAYNANQQMNLYLSEYFFVMQITAGNNIDLESIDTTINGALQNIFPVNTAYLLYLEEENQTFNDSVIENFINGTQYTTRTDYQTVITHINSALQNGVSITLNNQNYANEINNKIFPYTASADVPDIELIMKIALEYDRANANEIPKDQPYTPFGNYGNVINYDRIQYTTEVNAGGTGEIVDIPGIMFAMLGMPFTFVAQAFNLTIFPGTAYAINLSQIFLAVVGAGILLFIIKKILK